MKNAEINLVSVITSDGSEDKTEYTVSGFFDVSGDTVTVKYTEPAQSELERTKTHLTVTKSEAIIDRCGGVKMKMVIIRGKTLPVAYKTAYGELVLETRGKEVFQETKDGKTVITLAYDLCSGGEIVSSNKLILNIREV